MIKLIPKMQKGKVLSYYKRLYPKYADLINKVNIVDDKENFYDPSTNTIHYTGDDEFLVHELGHALGNGNELHQLYNPYSYNDSIFNPGQWYADMKFINASGDPRNLYDNFEVFNRVRAAKFKSQGQKYTTDFFKNLRQNERMYGDNMRDLLHMYDDDNLVKLFQIEKEKRGGRLIKNK